MSETSQHTFALPDVGEGLTEAEILRWLVAPGDRVEVNQPLVEIETAKAAVELPSPVAATVGALLVEAGSVVPVGTAIITFDDAQQARQPVLVGYGVSTGRRRRRSSPAASTTAPADPNGAASDSVDVPAQSLARPLAKPPVRKLAREQGVDLATVTPTGAHGEVTRADVLSAGGGARSSVRTDAPGVSPGRRVEVRGVQRSMAEAMVRSSAVPQVTEWLDVDVTRCMRVVARLRERDPSVRISPMAIVALGLIRAVRLEPWGNATWVDDGPAIDLHARVHLGIAADTDRGLVVPVVHDADGMSLIDLAGRIQTVVEAARAGTCTPAQLTGGTVTLTNIGVLGVDGGTPILNPGQSAILAMGRVVERPWVVDGAIAVRSVMQLSLSFDHRIIDGATGARILRSVAEFVSDPALALLLDGWEPATA